MRRRFVTRYPSTVMAKRGSRSTQPCKAFLKQFVFQNNANRYVRNAWHSKQKTELAPAEFLARNDRLYHAAWLEVVLRWKTKVRQVTQTFACSFFVAKDGQVQSHSLLVAWSFWRDRLGLKWRRIQLSFSFSNSISQGLDAQVYFFKLKVQLLFLYL